MLGQIRNSNGETLDYELHQGLQEGAPVVVLGHGVTGNKDRPLLITLAEGLAGSGIACLRFSFSGNGNSEGRFEDSTVSKEVTDLGAVLDVLGNRPIAYAGHSMGAAVGVLRAVDDGRLRWLISLAGMVHTQAFAAREFGMVTPGQGHMWDKPDCPLSEAYVADMRRIESVLPLAPRVSVPWLLVHGTEDDVVPIQESREMFARANQPKQLEELAGADHVFSPPQTEAMVEKVVSWIKQQMGVTA